LPLAATGWIQSGWRRPPTFDSRIEVQHRVALLVDYAPWLLAMLLLLCGSAFFSASEAALFYLSRRERRAFANGNAAQQIAAALLEQPDRLLTTVLFWNLMVNISYFTLSSVVALRLQRDGRLAEATWLTIGSLIAI